MAPTTEKILEATLALSPDEQHELIHALIAATEPADAPSLEDGWRETIRRRSSELENGTVAPIPWDEAKARVHQRLGLDD
jgi:putative addiction module component (TIGR02574 family)